MCNAVVLFCVLILIIHRGFSLLSDHETPPLGNSGLSMKTKFSIKSCGVGPWDPTPADAFI